MLKQGLGRLIRSASDHGILAVLDSRLLRKSYGRRFLESLPPRPPGPRAQRGRPLPRLNGQPDRSGDEEQVSHMR
jgi:hypothetical protein